MAVDPNLQSHGPIINCCPITLNSSTFTPSNNPPKSRCCSILKSKITTHAIVGVATALITNGISNIITGVTETSLPRAYAGGGEIGGGLMLLAVTTGILLYDHCASRCQHHPNDRPNRDEYENLP